MRVDTTKSWFAIDSSGKLVSFSRHLYTSSKFSLEIKESLLIKRDKPLLNKNISSAPLFLFDRV